MKTTNCTVLDLNKVQYGTLWWRNGLGAKLPHKPKCPTVNGCEFDLEALAAPLPQYEGETMLERATRLDLLDAWTPVVTFQLTANHSICYVGKKAINMWKAWQSHVFARKKKEKK